MNMKNKVAITFGGSGEVGKEKDGFNIEASFDLGNDLTPLSTAIARYGMVSLLYRGGASRILRTLFPKGTKSTEIGFSEELSAKITVLLTEWFQKGCPATRESGASALPEGLDVEIVVSKYELGTATTKKWAAEKKMLAVLESTSKWSAVLAKLGFDENTSHEGGEFSPALCAAYAKFREDAAKAALDGI